MIYFTAHTFNCVCHCIRAMFIVLGMYNFALNQRLTKASFKVAKVQKSFHLFYK